MSVKDLIRTALQANNDHQYALNVYIERIEEELQTVSKLLALGEAEEEETDEDLKGLVLVPAASKPLGLFSSAELVAKDSEFYHDGSRRKRCLRQTVPHSMGKTEHMALADAVRMEHYRLAALESQRQGLRTSLHFPHRPGSSQDWDTDEVDWERVAKKVSDISQASEPRSALECKIRWIGDQQPSINHSPWLPAEVKHAKQILKSLQSEEGEIDVDWVKLSKELGTNRTPIDCLRHVITPKRHIWSEDYDKELLASVQIYGLNNWNLVAKTLSENVTAQQCQQRYSRSLDPNLKHGKWTEAENKALLSAHDTFGNAWADIAAYIPGRNNDQCRERHALLTTGVSRGGWSAEEDEHLKDVVQTVLNESGQFDASADVNIDWSAVCERMDGQRTEASLAKRWSSITKADKEPNSAPLPSGSTTSTQMGRVLKGPKPMPRARLSSANSAPSVSESIANGMDLADGDADGPQKKRQRVQDMKPPKKSAGRRKHGKRVGIAASQASTQEEGEAVSSGEPSEPPDTAGKSGTTSASTSSVTRRGGTGIGGSKGPTPTLVSGVRRSERLKTK